MPTQQLLHSVLFPAVIAAVMLLIAWWPKQRSHRGWWGGAVGLAAGFVFSFVREQGWPEMPPRSQWEWIAPLAVFGGLIGLFTSLLPTRIWTGWSTALILGLATGWMINLKGLEPPVLWRVMLGATVFVLFIALDPLAQKRRGVTFPLMLWSAFAAGSILLLQVGFAKLTFMCAAMSAMCAAAAVIAITNRQLSLARGGMAVIATLLPTLMLLGHYYNEWGDVPDWCLAVPVAAPLLLWLGEHRVIARRRPWQALLLRFALVAVPCAIAVAVVVLMKEESGGYEY